MRFVLMDPDKFPEETEEAPTVVKETPEMSVYPNPATGNTNISYEVKTAGKVSIELLDGNGNVVRTLLDKEMMTGKQKVQLNTSGLQQNTTYYVRYTGPEGSVMQKLILIN